MARGLWNNLLQPVGQKSLDYEIGVPFLCPSPQRPYIATHKNSLSSTRTELFSNMEEFVSLMGTLPASSSQCPIWPSLTIISGCDVNLNCAYGYNLAFLANVQKKSSKFLCHISLTRIFIFLDCFFKSIKPDLRIFQILNKILNSKSKRKSWWKWKIFFS